MNNLICIQTIASTTRRSTVPSRLSNKHGTLIDNILCKLTDNTIDTTSGVLISKISDHQPYFLILDNVQIKQNKPAR